jgi:hypothetical protein
MRVMTDPRNDRPADGDARPVRTLPPSLAEDVMLVLFDPRSGAIAGEGTLYYVLGGAVLTELALSGSIAPTGRTGFSGELVAAADGAPPSDPLLREAWDAVREKPRGVQTLLASVGPRLRAPLLERLVARGDIREERRKVLGLIPTTALRAGDGRRRGRLIGSLRATLVDGRRPDERTAALGGLVFASGSLPSLDPELPWSSTVHDRAKRLQEGEWGASAAAEAVQRTIMAVITASVTAAVTAATTSSSSN